MNTQPDVNTAAPSAYKQLTTDLQHSPETEKTEYINSQFEMISAIVKIDNIVKMSKTDLDSAQKLISTDYKEIFEKYNDIYIAGNYLKYADNIFTEFNFLNKISLEIEQINNYENFLSEIQNKATQLSQISIFSKEGSYDSLNIKATAKAYEDISGIATSYYPQEGLVTALNFRYSDLILIMLMILLASHIVRNEKDSGLLTLIRTSAAGKTKTAIAKLLAMSASLLISVITVYIVNLIYCNATFGLGNLLRSIQSIPYLMRSTLKINILEYLFIFVFTKWIAALICGTWILFCMLISKRVFIGYFLSLSFPLINLLIRNAIPATSHLNVIKYANLASLLTTNEILGSYRNIYWFGKPVQLFLVEIIAALIFSVVFITLFILTFEHFQLSKSEVKFFNFKIFKKIKSTTILRQEWYKLLIMNGGIVVLIIFSVFQMYTAYTSENYITAEEMFYAYYMKALTGPYDIDAYNFILSESEKFKPLVDAQKMFQYGAISNEEYNVFMSANYALNLEYSVFNNVLTKINILTSDISSQLIYDTGYIKLFDLHNIYDVKDYLYITLVICVMFSGLFCIEKTSGVIKILKTTPLGMRHTAKSKIKITIIMCCILTLLSIFPRIYQIGYGYGFVGLSVPAKNIELLNSMDSNISIFMVILIFIFSKFITIFTTALVVLCISQKSNSYLSAVMFSLLILEFPILLFYLGVDLAQWVTLYNVFHFTQSLTNSISIFISILYLILSIFIIKQCCDFLITEYSISY